MQGLLLTVSDLLVKHTSQGKANYEEPMREGFPILGLPALQAMQLQGDLLNVIMMLASDDSKRDSLYIGRHVMPVCTPPFVEYAQACMDLWMQKGVPDRLTDVKPYFLMLGALTSLLWSMYPGLSKNRYLYSTFIHCY